MATPFPAPVSALQVGSYFVQQYYQVLQQHPDYVHQFYSDASTMVRVDGDSSETASSMLQIHTVVTSLNFTSIEIKTINSLESLSGGVVLVVSGSVKSKDFNGWRKFVQTFFLAPQEKGYFVLNDIFHFVTDEVIHQNSAPITSEKQDSRPATSNLGLEVSVSDYTSEVETREFINSVRIDGDDQVDEYSLKEHQQTEYGLQENYQQHEYGLQEQYQQYEYGLQEQYQQYEYGLQEQYQQHEYTPLEQYQQHEYALHEQHQQQEPDAEIIQEEAPLDEQSDLLPNAVQPVQEPLRHVEEPIGDLPKLSYAYILRTSKGKSAPLVTSKTSSAKIIQPSSERNHIPPPPVQQSNPELPSAQDHNVEVADEGFLQEEGESKSVYVRNLPPNITTLDILHEFKNFGRVSSDGMFIKNRKEVGVCYAFVEFEDIQGVQNAIKASPIQLAGRQVYIEGRRANSSSSAPRGGMRARGRGRGSYQNEGQRGHSGTRPSGRGSNQDAGDYKIKGNGFRGS